MGIGFIGIVENIICNEFEKRIGRNQASWDKLEAMLLSFRIDTNYKIEEGYRHLDLMIYAPHNYVGVFVKEKWDVIPKEDLECGDDFDPVVKKGKDYHKGQTRWLMEGYHDSCWRDAVNRVLWDNRDRINMLDGFSYWYKTVDVTEELLKDLEPLMHREGDYRYEVGKEVLFFDKKPVKNEKR